MPDDNQVLRSILRAGMTDALPDEESGLPDLDSGQYQPFARPANKPVHSIHFVNPMGEVRSFQYIHLDSDARYAAGRIVLQFLGLEPTKVVITGRNLWRLYDYIHQNRIPWIAVAARDFASDGQAIVTGVTFGPAGEGSKGG